MHVLVISSIYPPSGGIFVHDQVLALRSEGLRVGVLAPDFPHPSRVISGKFSWANSHDSYTIDDVPVRKFIFFPAPYIHIPFTALFASISILRYIKKYGKPDLIHSHLIWYGGIIGSLIGKIFNIPVVLTCHHSKHFKTISFNNFLEAKWVLKNVDYRISVSEILKNRLIKLYGSYQIEVIPNTVNTDFFAPVPKKILKSSQFHYTSIGHLRPNKGFENLIRAFSKINNKDHSVLNIVGEGPDHDHLVNLVSDLKLSEKVIFHGSLSREKLIGLLQKSDVVVSASQLETFGVTIIEALSCGIPVVATRSGGPEGIINKDNGILVEKDSINELCSGLENIYRNYSNYDPNRIRAACVKNYGYGVIAERLLNVYENL